MGTCERFEDLPVWRSAVELGARVFALTDDRVFQTQGELRQQLQRTAMEISSYIAEGCERGSTSELLRFLEMARGSAGNLRSMLSFALHIEAVRTAEASEVFSAEGMASLVDDMKSHAESCSRELQDLIDTLRDTSRLEHETAGHPAHTVFIPGEHVKAFIAKLEKFRAGADPRDVFGRN